MLNNYNIVKLTAKKYRPLIYDYLAFLQLGQHHFANRKITSDTRLEKLRLLEKILRRRSPFNSGLIFRLQQNFLKENISVTLLLEPLSAWRYTAADKMPDSGAQLSELLNRLLAPAARLFLVLDNENPCTYLPLTSLFIMLSLLEMCSKNSEYLTKAKMSKRQKESRLKGLYKSASVLLQLIKNKRLKFKLALLLNTAKFQLSAFQNNKQQKLSLLDYTLIFLYSLWQFATIKRKSVNNKGI